tara:strand:- start:6888 stop:7085 length:198 start_codon:yes stop_codon:yes gene_type:complete
MLVPKAVSDEVWVLVLNKEESRPLASSSHHVTFDEIADVRYEVGFTLPPIIQTYLKPVAFANKAA